jgi:predicted PurR-regulated permease PerM
MPKINLLPPDLVPKKSIIRISGILIKVVYAAIAIFLVFVITMVAIVVINLTKTNSLKEQQDSLINSVKEYEETEMQMILAKDRMAKIKDIWSTQDIKSHLEKFEELIPLLSEGATIRTVKLSPAKSEITIEFTSSLLVTKFMGSLVTLDLYKKIILTNFSFNPNYGYRISFEGYMK